MPKFPFEIELVRRVLLKVYAFKPLNIADKYVVEVIRQLSPEVKDALVKLLSEVHFQIFNQAFDECILEEFVRIQKAVLSKGIEKLSSQEKEFYLEHLSKIDKEAHELVAREAPASEMWRCMEAKLNEREAMEATVR
jgi:hypothetical protein